MRNESWFTITRIPKSDCGLECNDWKESIVVDYCTQTCNMNLEYIYIYIWKEVCVMKYVEIDQVQVEWAHQLQVHTKYVKLLGLVSSWSDAYEVSLFACGSLLLNGSRAWKWSSLILTFATMFIGHSKLKMTNPTKEMGPNIKPPTFKIKRVIHVPFNESILWVCIWLSVKGLSIKCTKMTCTLWDQTWEFGHGCDESWMKHKYHFFERYTN